MLRPESKPRWDIWLILLRTLLVLAAFCVGMFLQQPRFRHTDTPIGEIQLGANVPGVNPGEADDLTFGTTVDRESWRHLRLTGRHSSGALIEIDLLRPQSWLAAHNAEEGAVIPVEFGRIGIVGPVKVESINECPEIRAGPGQSVTGIYRHHDAPTILDLETSNGERMGVTPDHRFWSVDQQAFVAAGDLLQGETLKLLDGTTRLASITTRPDTETVYTLEVQVEHVFHVAKSGVLVHNCNTGLPFNPSWTGRTINYKKGAMAPMEHIMYRHGPLDSQMSVVSRQTPEPKTSCLWLKKLRQMARRHLGPPEAGRSFMTLDEKSERIWMDRLQHDSRSTSTNLVKS